MEEEEEEREIGLEGRGECCRRRELKLRRRRREGLWSFHDWFFARKPKIQRKAGSSFLPLGKSSRLLPLLISCVCTVHTTKTEGKRGSRKSFSLSFPVFPSHAVLPPPSCLILERKLLAATGRKEGSRQRQWPSFNKAVMFRSFIRAAEKLLSRPIFTVFGAADFVS